MDFSDVPFEARSIAEASAELYSNSGFDVELNKALADDAPFRTTLIGSRGEESILVEAQCKLAYDRELRDLAHWLTAGRRYGALVIAVDGESDLPGAAVRDLKRDGVGLLLVHKDVVEVFIKPRAPALTVVLTPGLKLGKHREAVHDLITRFNDGERKSALQDMFEMVEGETGKIALRAAEKTVIDRTVQVVQSMDWSSRINVLASADRFPNGSGPLFDTKLKDDLHSFRGARNLIDHPAKNANAARKRELQFTERMTQGPRLLGELLSIGRKV